MKENKAIPNKTNKKMERSPQKQDLKFQDIILKLIFYEFGKQH